MPETPPPGATPTGFQRNPSGGIRWQPPTPEELALLLPGYEIECLLGRGGMGAVYKGLQKALDRPVAIKILPPDLDDADGSFAERFKNEARLMAKMDHPAIVAVFDFGVMSAGQLYFVMAFIDGTDVARMISEQGRLPAEHALAVTAHVCDALAYAHARGVVHRDIKPANVLITMEGQVKVADFGLAKAADAEGAGLTKTGLAMGTPDYVAPEALILGSDVDGRADLYAVGVMLYQMLTGVVPRGAWKDACVVVPGLDRRFDDIIDRAMQTDPSDRYQSAEELRRDLDVILTTPMVQEPGESSVAIPKQVLLASQSRRAPAKRVTTSAPAVVAKPEPSKLPWVIGIAAVVVLGVGGVVMMGKRGGEEEVTPVPVASQRESSPSVQAKPQPKPAEIKTTPVASTSSVPPVSKSPSTPLAASSDQFPPGKWVKVFTKFEDLPEKLRKNEAKIQMIDGKIIPAGNMDLRVESLEAGNLGIRAVIETPNTRLNLGQSGFGNVSAKINPAKSVVEIFSFPINEPSKVLSTLSLPSFDQSVPHSVEFTKVGNRYFLRINDKLAGTFTYDEYSSPFPSITGIAPIRDIEVINFDGLPEAEALTILGVDEKGKDLRQPAAVTSMAPAAPVSSPPAPQVSPSPEKFPPGQWVKVFNPGQVLTPSGTWRDGWIEGGDILYMGEFAKTSAKNRGIRMVIDSNAQPSKKSGAELLGGLWLRNTGEEAYILRLNRTGHLDFLRAPQTEAARSRLGGDRVLRSSEKQPFDESGQITLEFSAVGSRLIARIDGRLVAVHEDSSLAEGRSRLAAPLPVRDIEVINLDGLPEAEALRLLGVDEQGNDLRAVAAKEAEAKTAAEEEAAAIAAIPELKELHAQFEKLRAERVEAVFTADLATLNTGYLGGLDRTIAEEKRDGHLDGVLALEEEKKAIAAGQPLTADKESTPEALKELRQIYRDSFAKLETQRTANLKTLTDPLGVRLRQLESSLTQKNRIDDAKFVRGYRERLELGESAVLANNEDEAREADKGASAPAKKFPSGDDRKAAEWVISVGGTLKVQDSDREISVSDASSLPPGSFTISEIDLKPQTASFDGIAPLAGLNGLRRFSATGPDITDEDTDIMASWPQITVIDLSYTTDFTGAEAAKLKECRTLTDLVLGGTKVSGAGLAQIGQIDSLERLNLGNCRINDDDVASLISLKKLESLRLHLTSVSVDGWQKLKNLPLTSIGFHGAPGKMAEQCKKLAGLFPNVKTVEFAPIVELSAEDLSSLGEFRLLYELQFTSAQINDTSIKGISGFANLGVLSLKSTSSPISSVTEEGMEALVAFKALKRLSLQNFKDLSDVTLTTVTKLKRLESLTIRDCPQITPAAIEAFQKARPDVTVTR